VPESVPGRLIRFT